MADTTPLFETVLYEMPEPGIIRVVMNRPAARNAQNLRMTYDLDAALAHAAQDDAVKVVILAGVDPHFSAGHDLRATNEPRLGHDLPVLGHWGGFDEPGAHGRFAREQEIYLQVTRRWRNLAKPTIAAVTRRSRCTSSAMRTTWRNSARRRCSSVGVRSISATSGPSPHPPGRTGPRSLRESVERFAAGRYAPDQRKQYAAGAHGYSAAMWAEMAELGWLALPIPEAMGGLGAGAVETGIVMEGAGRALMAEPLLPSTVAVSVIAALASPAQAEQWLPAIAEGRLLAVLAHSERHMRLDRGMVRTEAARDGDGWRLRGAKDAVMAGGAAGLLLVSARIGDGMGVFAVEAGAAMQSYPVVGGGAACNLSLDVALGADALLGARDDAGSAVAAALDMGGVALAAESVGCMTALLEATTAYTRTRTQFGRPLSDNQVLRHRMVDMAIACEEARAIALRAAVMMDGPGRARAASAAKARTSRAARAGDPGPERPGGAAGLSGSRHRCALIRCSPSKDCRPTGATVTCCRTSRSRWRRGRAWRCWAETGRASRR